MVDQSLDGRKIVLVTGASYGLGYTLALEAASSGAHVIALARTQGALDDLADAVDKTTGSITLVPMDITDDNAIAYMAANLHTRFGKLDYWLHTAWFSAQMQPAAHILLKDMDKSYRTNIRATAKLIHLLDPLLREGKAVFFDQDGLNEANLSNMGLAKNAQITLARAWALETNNLGNKVSIVTPKPFFSNLRSTLTPGLTRAHFSTAAIEAKDIWSQI